MEKKCKQCRTRLCGKQEKFCSKMCKQQFHNKLHSKDPGRLIKHKEWRDKNKEQLKENQKKYYQKHKEEIKQKRREYHRLHPETDKRYKQTPKGRMLTYKRGAITRNLSFKLELSFFEKNFNKQCGYCGDRVNGIGIDRINNLVGYEIDNVIVCCELCNKMKLNHTKEFFINHCKKITINLATL